MLNHCFYAELVMTMALISYRCCSGVASGWLVWMLPTFIMWMINGTIVTAVLARIFVFGEPITKPLSESSVRYWRHRKQADMDLAKVRIYMREMNND